MNEVTSLTSSIEALKSEEIYSESVVKKIAQIKTDRFSFEDSAFFFDDEDEESGFGCPCCLPR
ncbi:MAG: hypothetical protein EOO90_32035 [Pedobacter sp.]|nr:MAG: hypothetical protein EOO90_32035 [Pedobacter sp.]